MKDVYLKPTHEAADAFWEYWRENGETHKHGYYESTWGAINAAIKVAGLVEAERSPHPLVTRWRSLKITIWHWFFGK